MDQYESFFVRENMFPKDNLFLQFLAYGKDKSQKYQIIKFINKSQYYLLKKIAKNILKGVIPLKKNQLKHLRNSKIFIRKLAEGKVKKSELLHYYTIPCYIVKIALEHYEAHSKISTGSNQKMGRNRRQECCKRSFSENSSSDESTSSPQSNFSNDYPESEDQQGLGKIEKSNPSQMFLYLSPKKRSKGSLLLHYLENSENIE